MFAEDRLILENSLRKIEADLAVVKLHAQRVSCLKIYMECTVAQEHVRDAIVELIPDPPIA
jgi:hypothetical protein